MNKAFNIGNLLVGYIGIIKQGMIIPADAVLIHGKNVAMDKSPISGETEILKKKCYEQCVIERDQIMHVVTNADEELKNMVPSPILISGSL